MSSPSSGPSMYASLARSMVERILWRGASIRRGAFIRSFTVRVDVVISTFHHTVHVLACHVEHKYSASICVANCDHYAYHVILIADSYWLSRWSHQIWVPLLLV